MTTLVYRDRIIASDTKVTSNGIIRGSTVKMFVNRSSVWAMCGKITDMVRFKQWVIEGMPGKHPDFQENCGFGAMQATHPNGEVWCWNYEFVPQPIDADFYAMGSGNELALGAMAMGATAIQAIAVAAMHDSYTGGKVHVFYVKDELKEELIDLHEVKLK